MFDIFDEKEQPKIYMADFEILASIPARGTNKFEHKTIRIQKHPVLITGGEIATEKQRDRLFRGVYDRFIKKSEFDKIKFKIVKMENLKYMSNICYHFDYDVD
jgi:hypothetical protein